MGERREKPAEPLDLNQLQHALGYRFDDVSLLERALSHRSHAYEVGRTVGEEAIEHNEPLEFLGDAVLGFAVAERIFRRRPELDEGAMTRLRASLVNTRRLAREARALGIDRAVRLGRGEESSGGRDKPSVQANTLEAILGAILLDGGVRAARSFVLRLFKSEIDTRRAHASASTDPKTKLQEWLQARGRSLPEYALIDVSGPDHAREFVIEVRVKKRPYGQGRGTSKKRAQQDAAAQALTKLVEESAE